MHHFHAPQTILGVPNDLTDTKNANHDSRVRWNNSLVDQVAGSRESPGLTKAPRHLRKPTLIMSDVLSPTELD